MPWLPVLFGSEAAGAREAAARIAADLSRHSAEDGQDPSLVSGAAGIAVFLHYAAAAGIWPEGAGRAASLLRRTVADANRSGLGPALYMGTPGIAWAVIHTQPPAAASMVAAAVDAGLASYLDELPNRAHFDLISGLVGHGVYASERLPETGARELSERVVQRLAERARRVDGGIAWAAESAGEGNPAGAHLNLGVAHGTPGVISWLASCHAAGVARRRVGELLPPAVAWVLAQRLEDQALPYWIEPGARAARSRVAWCYGDPGVAYVLLRAGRALGRHDWEAAALEQATAAALRSPDETGVEDAALCHGALGLAHVFGRLYAATREEAFASAARDWISWAFERRDSAGALGGFLTLERDASGRAHEHAVPGFLTGAAGIGLALTAAASDLEPAWDRLLLLSGP